MLHDEFSREDESAGLDWSKSFLNLRSELNPHKLLG